MSQRARRNCILKDHFCFQSFYKVPFIRPQRSPYVLCASLWVISFHYELKIQAFSVSEVCFLTSPAFCSRETVWFYESSHWPLNVSSIMEILLPTKSTPRSPPPTPSLWVVVLCVFPFLPSLIPPFSLPLFASFSLHQPALFKRSQASVYSSALLLTEKLALKKTSLIYYIDLANTHTLFKSMRRVAWSHTLQYLPHSLLNDPMFCSDCSFRTF